MSLGRCETCRFAKPEPASYITCKRIVASKFIEPGTTAVITSIGEGDMDPTVHLFVVPEFGCVLWEEP